MNKSVIVTGASRGIGAQIAKDFAKEGYNVLINYNNSERAHARTLDLESLWR